MVHKTMLRKDEGYVVEVDGSYVFLTKVEFEKGRKRFDSRFGIEEMRGLRK